ncbi:MAG: hypothetical protein FJZ11_00225 [Candidatus Omnitrophica bacterium]|nr:hypothetical protein [Candidatus Omnitrophota bacterium]
MKNYQDVKKIIFVDTPELVDIYINKNRAKGKITGNDRELFIAMNPRTNSYLMKKELPCLNTLSFFNNESHIKALEKSRVIVGWLEEKYKLVDIKDNIGIGYRDSLIYFSRFACHYCIWAIEIILNAIDTYNPKVICASVSYKTKTPSLFVEYPEKYLGHIVNLIAHQRKIDFEDIAEEVNKKSAPAFILRAINCLKLSAKFVLKHIWFELWQGLIILTNQLIKNSPVIFTTKFYQMDKLAAQFKKEHPDKRLYFLQGPIMAFSKNVRVQKKLFMRLVAAIKEESSFFSYRDILFADILADKIEDNIADYIIGLMLWSKKLNRMIDLIRPALVVSAGNRADDVILAELCKQKNIPAILISHGSHVFPKNEYETIEWGEHGRFLMRAPFSFIASQSPLVEGFLGAFPSSDKIIKTGPLIWGRPVNFDKSKSLLKGMSGGRQKLGKLRVLLHAGTSKASKHLRFLVYETPEEYIQAISDLANAVIKIPDAILIIKFRPTSEISIEDLKTYIPFSDKVILSTEESFADILGITDLLVSFSSTTIEEALQNKIPVLLYGGGGRYQHIPACGISANTPLRKSTLYHVKRAQDLECAIKEIFSLNIDRFNDGDLFKPYIYPESERISLASLLK